MPSLPQFVIVGAQKAGTTAAARNLALHPQLRIFSGRTEYGQRELEFFNQHWDRGAVWYASHFPLGDWLSGEKTAELLHRTVCHERMRSLIPGAQLIVLLRCPTARAYSQWKMAALDKQDEPRSFDDVIADELRSLDSVVAQSTFDSAAPSAVSTWREGYIRKGLYVDQLSSLLTSFPASQVHIAISERVRARPTEEYNRMFRFLGVEGLSLAPYSEHFCSPVAPEMSRWSRDVLRDIYRPSIRRLEDLIGESLLEWHR